MFPKTKRDFKKPIHGVERWCCYKFHHLNPLQRLPTSMRDCPTCGMLIADKWLQRPSQMALKRFDRSLKNLGSFLTGSDRSVTGSSFCNYQDQPSTKTITRESNSSWIIADPRCWSFTGMMPVREPTIVPVREPVPVDREPTIVPPNETVAEAKIRVAAIRIRWSCVMTNAPSELFICWVSCWMVKWRLDLIPIPQRKTLTFQYLSTPMPNSQIAGCIEERALFSRTCGKNKATSTSRQRVD